MSSEREMPKYQCHKQVWALKIKSIVEGVSNEHFAEIGFEEDGYGPIFVSADWFYSRKPHIGGYYVAYKDGYTSFSPADAFDEGYSLCGKKLPDIEQLMTFYGCDSISCLIEKQAHHVDQLLDRLKPYLGEPHKISRVREG